MKNFLGRGEVVTVVAPEAVDSGEFIVVGALRGVAQTAAAVTELVPLVREGVFSLPKATGAVWAQGDRLYWDTTAKKFTKVAAGNVLMAVAFAAALTGDTEGAVYLNAHGVGFKIAAGQITTATATDTVLTGLGTVLSAHATMEDSPVDDPFMATAVIGDQAGVPAAGSIIVKTWKNTGGTDPTPAAATTFAKKVNWSAFGI